MKTLKFMHIMKKNWKIATIIVLVLINLGYANAMQVMEKELKTAQNSKPETITKEIEKVVEVNKTPQDCKDLIEIDNEIFVKLGEYFNKVSAGASKGDVFEFVNVSASAMQELNQFVDKKSDTRTKLATNCIK